MSPQDLARLDNQVPAHVAEPEVMTLVQMAVEQKVPVEILERLMDMQERIEAKNARAAFFEARAQFQEDCPEIRQSKTANIKTKSGANFSYTYAPLPEITRTIRPILRKVGLSYSWDVSAATAGVLTIACVLRHIDGHEERASFPVPIAKDGRMSDAQANGAALTYGRRQSLIAVLGLTTADQDADGVQGVQDLDPECITETQAAELDDLIEAVGVNRARFLKWAGVEMIRDIKACDYQAAVAAVESKRA